MVDETGFRIRCEGNRAGSFLASTDKLTVTVGQRIVRNGIREMWDFVFVSAEQSIDGQLKTRILLCHPDWDDPVELACIESNREGVTVGLTHDYSQPP